MPLRNRIGAFFLLAGVFFLFIFATSVFSPTGDYAVMPLLGGAALLVMGWRWRTAKGGKPFGRTPPSAPAGMPGKGGPPPGPPKKQGPLSALLKGPAAKKMAPKGGGPPGGGGGGGGSGGKPGGAPGGKPGGGKPGGGKPGGGPPKGKK